MKDSLVFALGALLSFPFSGYLSIGRWEFVLAVIFVSVVACCGGICGLAMKEWIIKKILKIQ